MITRIYQWLMRLASSERALLWLALVSFVEASVFPIPPDVMLIPMVLAAPSRWWRVALVATVASVAGGWLGYGIGATLYDTIGHKVIALYHMETGFARLQAEIQAHGGWYILVKGLLPIPFKLVTIVAGIARLDPVTFTVAAFASRALRFFLVATLLRLFGEPIRDFIEKRLTLVTTGGLVVLVGGFVVLRWL